MIKLTGRRRPEGAGQGTRPGITRRGYVTARSPVSVVGVLLAVALVFSATFTQANPGRWTPNWLGDAGQITSPPNPSYERAAFDPARVDYRPGGLALSVRRDPVTIAGSTYPYRSGAVTGYRKQAYLFGYFSARIFVPCEDGTIVNWPAFWLVGDADSWPATGEIDVFEGLEGAAWWHFHFRDAAGAPASDGGRVAGRYCGWHTFAVSWRRDAIRWYYDDALVATVTKGITCSPMFPVFSYSVTDPGSAFCARYPYACGGKIDVRAVMRVSRFTVRS